HNTLMCTRRAFGLWRALNYEPGNVLYMPDDSGQMVQVVTLVKWVGLIFPWPEFGGVQVIPQGNTNIFGRVFLGCGHWIRPSEIDNYSFLRGQNLVPPVVSRFMAQSQRFQAGFFGPLSISRQGDLRIADVPDDVNPLPFNLFFRFSERDPGKLYQYVALE